MPRHPKIDEVIPGTNETRAERIIATIRTGNYATTAAAYAGVDDSTLYRWLDKAETDPPGGRYRTFREAVERARAEAEVDSVARIRQVIRGGAPVSRVPMVTSDGKAVLGPDGKPVYREEFAQPDGRLALEFLSRTAGRRFVRRQALEVSGSDGGPVEIRDEAALALAASFDRFLERASAPRELEPPTVVEGEAVEVDREPIPGTGDDDG